MNELNWAAVLPKHPFTEMQAARDPLALSPKDRFVVLGTELIGGRLLPFSTNETIDGARQSAELAVESGRMVETLVVEKVCKVTRPPAPPKFVTDFFEED